MLEWPVVFSLLQKARYSWNWAASQVCAQLSSVLMTQQGLWWSGHQTLILPQHSDSQTIYVLWQLPVATDLNVLEFHAYLQWVPQSLLTRLTTRLKHKCNWINIMHIKHMYPHIPYNTLIIQHTYHTTHTHTLSHTHTHTPTHTHTHTHTHAQTTQQHICSRVSSHTDSSATG